MPVMVGERCRTKTGIQDAKNEYTGLQSHTGYRITVRYDGRNGNANQMLAIWGWGGEAIRGYGVKLFPQ
jgi:hypothetical protein